MGFSIEVSFYGKLLNRILVSRSCYSVNTNLKLFLSIDNTQRHLWTLESSFFLVLLTLPGSHSTTIRKHRDAECSFNVVAFILNM